MLFCDTIKFPHMALHLLSGMQTCPARRRAKALDFIDMIMPAKNELKKQTVKLLFPSPPLDDISQTADSSRISR